MTNELILKWGSVKGWDLDEGSEAFEALKKWRSFGVSASALMHHDTDDQREALLDLIDKCDYFYLDWDDRDVTKEEAKEYVINYGKNKTHSVADKGVSNERIP